jgi:hypothetical protein
MRGGHFRIHSDYRKGSCDHSYNCGAFCTHDLANLLSFYSR